MVWWLERAEGEGMVNWSGGSRRLGGVDVENNLKEWRYVSEHRCEIFQFTCVHL
jgi:hypothetical protein